MARTTGLSDMTFIPTHRHVRTGTLYQVLFDKALDVTADEAVSVIVYRNEEKEVFTQLAGRFLDGRFESLNVQDTSFPLLARIEGEDIVIRLEIAVIPIALEIAVDIGTVSPAKIFDAPLFAKDFVAELNREDEEGTTPVMTLFDKALENAINNGAEGVELPPDEHV